MTKTISVKEYNAKGKLVAVYGSIQETADRGFDPSNVRKVVNGQRKTCLGKTFKKATQKEVNAIKRATGKETIGRIAGATLVRKGVAVK